jgi:hypothetical protein
MCALFSLVPVFLYVIGKSVVYNKQWFPLKKTPLKITFCLKSLDFSVLKIAPL